MALATPKTLLAQSTILLRVGLVVLALVIGAIIWGSQIYFTERFSQPTREAAEKRLALYSGRILSELQRGSVVPLLLSRDNLLVLALETDDFVTATQRLASYQNEIGLKGITLFDTEGRVVSATDRRLLGSVERDRPYFFEAIRADGTIFTATGLIEGQPRFFYSRRIDAEKDLAGVVQIEIDLAVLFERWSNPSSNLFLTQSTGVIIAATELEYVHENIADVLSDRTRRSVVERAIRATGDWSETYLSDRPLFSLTTDLPFQGWKLRYVTPYDPVRQQVNNALAIEIMVLALILALGFYQLSRRAMRQSFLFKAESEELRALNERLSTVLEERAQIEANLKVAEQSLEQSSKLAALGEMSAAVSHELNQPLAAMRTYLAGAKLLLRRSRPEEAVASFQRIDDLIDRMGAITRQLKSHARKGGSALEVVDFRDSVHAALSMMSPQLSKMLVEIDVELPREPVLVQADPLRMEQVIVNIIRNGLDAIRDQQDRHLDLFMSRGETAALYIRDNGPGIAELDQVFEPFYTTKDPGEGLGLGLAISSGIAKDLGGRLIARNRPSGGAEFEFRLPLRDSTEQIAAE